MPIKLGAMGGPRSFRLAGEKFDGLHHALGYTREDFEYVMENLKAGAESAGRDWRELDLAAWVVWSCGDDSAAAKETARIMVAFYLAAMPESQLQRHGISGSDLKPILDAFDAGDTQKALDLTSPELGEMLSISGTPEECLAKLQRDILPTGINHSVAGVVDSRLLSVLADRTVTNGVDAATQLQLIHDRVMPGLATIGAGLPAQGIGGARRPAEVAGRRERRRTEVSPGRSRLPGGRTCRAHLRPCRRRSGARCPRAIRSGRAP